MAALIKYWMLSGRTLLLFGLLPVLAGSLIGMQGWLWKQDASSFVENLREAEGRVLRIANGQDHLLIDVEYLNDDGVRYERQLKVDSRQAAELRAVGKVSLIYDLRYPQLAEIGHVVSANNARLLYLAMAVAGGLLCLAGFAVLAREAKDSAAKLSLFRIGQLVQTEVRNSALAPGTAAGRFTYAFRGPDGRWYEGRSPQMPARRLAEWAVGRRILVAYDHMNPQRSEADVFGMVNEKRRSAVQAA
jgi:hypothetical protein